MWVCEGGECECVREVSVNKKNIRGIDIKSYCMR